MSRSARDLIVAAVVCIALIFVFARIELVELVFEATRDQEDWDLDEIIAAIPAIALAAAWYAARRRREAGTLNRRLQETVTQLENAIAQRREMEEQLQEAYKQAAVGTVAGGLAHDLNNALQPIMTLAQLNADRAGASAATRTEMRHILEAAERGRAIVEGTLAFAAGGREPHELVPAQWIDAFVDRARDSVAPVEVDTRIGDSAGFVRVNRGELDHVLRNLLTNAAEAMKHQGSVTIGLDTRSLDAEAAQAHGLAAGDYIRVTVTDRGPGMSPEVKSHVFDPFFTTKEAGDGAGLGLAVVYGLVRGWNGTVSVDSSPGSGATFEVLIPLFSAEG